MKKAALILILFFSILALPSLVLADCNGDPKMTPTELGCLPNQPVEFSGKIYALGLGLIGGVGLISIIYGGYLIISSKGDPQALNRGKSYIFYAILGIIMAVSGFALYRITAVDILKIPGFSG